MKYIQSVYQIYSNFCIEYQAQFIKALPLCGQCHVFIQEDGERSIAMAPASTSQISAENVQNYFGEEFMLDHIHICSMSE